MGRSGSVCGAPAPVRLGAGAIRHAKLTQKSAERHTQVHTSLELYAGDELLLLTYLACLAYNDNLLRKRKIQARSSLASSLRSSLSTAAVSTVIVAGSLSPIPARLMIVRNGHPAEDWPLIWRGPQSRVRRSVPLRREPHSIPRSQSLAGGAAELGMNAPLIAATCPSHRNLPHHRPLPSCD
jgi:hypothetical protein